MKRYVSEFNDAEALESIAVILSERLDLLFLKKDYQRYCLVYWAIHELGLRERVPMQELPLGELLEQLRSLYSHGHYGEYCIYAMCLSAIWPQIPTEEWLGKESALTHWYELMRAQLVWRGEPHAIFHLYLLTLSMIRLYGFVKSPLSALPVSRTIQALEAIPVFSLNPEFVVAFRICVSQLERHGRLHSSE